VIPAALRDRPWTAAALLAAGLAAVDGFVLTALQGAVGSVERDQGPFAAWAVHAVAMLPVYVLAVLGVFAVAQKRFRSRLLATAALLVVAGSAVGIADIAISGLADYRLQSAQIDSMIASHFHPAPALAPGQAAAGAPSAAPAAPGSCNAICVAKQQTAETDLKGAGVGAALVLVANVVLIGWSVALGGGQLGPAGRRPVRRREPMRV
jgi:hypothetical protein